MSRRSLTPLVLAGLGLLALWPTLTQAHGRHRGCADECGPVVVCAALAPAPEYVERTVTRYRAEYQTRQVPVTTYQTVTREEKYSYTVHEAVTTPQKRTETYYTTVQKEVPYTYSVMVPVTKAE